MLKTTSPTKLYDIRKKSGQEAYNSFCNGTVFTPRDMKIVGCFNDYIKCIEIKEEEKKHQSSPLKKI